MSRTLPVFAALLLICMSGCKSESESLASDMVDKQKELVKILKSVKDKDSAIAAQSKLQALGKDIGEMETKLSKKKPSDADMQKAMEKYKPEFVQAEKDMRAEMERIEKIPGAIEPLVQGMMNMGAGMNGGFGAPGMRP